MIAMRPKGLKHSEETKAKMRFKRIGQKPTLGFKHSVESKLKMSKSKIGKSRPLEIAKKLRIMNLGRKWSDKVKLNMSIAHKNIAQETRTKMSLSKLGNSNSKGFKWSIEQKRKLSLLRKGNKYRLGTKHSDEIKKKMSESHKKMSEETRFKMSLAGLGEKCHFWKGGLTKKTTLRIGRATWRLISKKIRRRDNYICQHCGAKETKLDVHHKIPYYLTQNDSFDNLITLCCYCHAKEERKFENDTAFLRINPVVFYG